MSLLFGKQFQFFGLCINFCNFKLKVLSIPYSHLLRNNFPFQKSITLFSQLNDLAMHMNSMVGFITLKFRTLFLKEAGSCFKLIF